MKIKASRDIVSSATSVNVYINEISRSITRIQNYLSSIPNAWQGDDATKFLNKFRNEAIPELQNYFKVMKDYQSFLAQVYPIFQALDEYYDKAIDID